ncbi:MAG: hypothetical protein IJ220_05950 [Clostridia bacterium]|nr:hypothetical protein [Clostridia bacterium]
MMIIGPLASFINLLTTIRVSRNDRISESKNPNYSTCESFESGMQGRIKRKEPKLLPLYKTDPEFKQAVDGLEEAVKSYRDFYNSLPPEKQLAEDYFWQEFVASLD